MGGTWFTPSKMQMEDLCRHCDVTFNSGKTGLVFSGKGSYAGLSIELSFNDLAGKPSPKWRGYYWTRNYVGTSQFTTLETANCLEISLDDPDPYVQMNETTTDYPCGVRAISY